MTFRSGCVILFLLTTLPGIAHGQWVPNGISFGDSIYELPHVCPDGIGGAIAALSVWRGPDTAADIFAYRTSAEGVPVWSEQGVAVCSAEWVQLLRALGPDGFGGALLAWVDARVSDELSIYAQRVDASGNVVWAADGVRVSTTPYDKFGAQVVSDGSGGAIIVWGETPSPIWSGFPSTILAQRVSANGNLLWADGGITLCPPVSLPNEFDILPDGAGGVIVAWTDYRSGHHIYAQHINVAGELLWTPDGVAVTAGANYEYGPVLVSDNTGGAIVAYAIGDIPNNDQDVGAQRISAAGFLQWGSGVALCSLAGDQITPDAVADGTGGAVVTWFDQRNGSSGDIYAQKIDASGIAQWEASGAPVCTTPGRQTNPYLTSDGLGGAIVTWWIANELYVDADVYVQRITVTGIPAWWPGGIAIGNGEGHNEHPAITADGRGGAYITWGRFGAISQDARLQRITQIGAVPSGIESTPALSPVLVSNRPNPFATSTMVSLTLTHDANVTVDVYDVAGRRVRTIDRGAVTAGLSEFSFDGKDDSHRALPSGVYFLQVRAGTNIVTRKIVIAR